jgi:hypothetical protein
MRPHAKYRDLAAEKIHLPTCHYPYFALPVKVSALIPACVLIAGLALGQGVGKILDFF